MKSRTEIIATTSTLTLLFLTLLSSLILSSSITSATDDNPSNSTSNNEPSDNVVDDISINVPASCTMGGVGSNTHTATIMNGTYSGAEGSDYENGIGKTTMTVFL